MEQAQACIVQSVIILSGFLLVLPKATSLLPTAIMMRNSAMDVLTLIVPNAISAQDLMTSTPL